MSVQTLPSAADESCPPHTIALRSHTITAILNNWNAPRYDGSQDARQWLRAIEEFCKIYGIPPVQMAEMAIKCTAGEANSILTPMLEAKVAEAGVWLWIDFKECVIQIEGEHSQPSQPQLWVVLTSCDRYTQAEYEGLVPYIRWRRITVPTTSQMLRRTPRTEASTLSTRMW